MSYYDNILAKQSLLDATFTVDSLKLQSLLAKSYSFNTIEDFVHLDLSLDIFLKNKDILPNVDSNLIMANDAKVDVNNITLQVLNHPDTSATSSDKFSPNFTFSLSQTLDFIEDINMNFKNVPIASPAQAPTTQPTKTVVVESEAPPRSSAYDVQTGTVASIKSNPFQSAKDQYIKEGAIFPSKDNKAINNNINQSTFGKGKSANTGVNSNSDGTLDRKLPPELERFDPALVSKIEMDIIQNGAVVEFKDIAGLEFAKKCVTEMICWPMTRPDLFRGLRTLPKGLLLFGPPGTGKTLIGKAIAHQTGATFFSISSSSLTSKWIGEGEQTVRVLFALATLRQPSVVFIDEVDSLLSQRSSEENEASRRMKTEFLVQLDGAGTDQSARVVIVGATNRPDELDEAARRRFVKRIYIPLPDIAGRKQLLQGLLKGNKHCLTMEDVEELAARTEGYSGADLRNLCTEAAMGPMRELAMRSGSLTSIREADVPSITATHFSDAFEAMAPSVSQADLLRYVEWNATFGSFRRME